MKHVKPVTRTPMPAAESELTLVEQIILSLIAIFFQDWENFSPVYENLQKYYAKTP